MSDVVRGLVAGALAGGAGTTALHALTYADMALRGRPVSRTPEQGVERLAAALHVQVPGDGDRRAHRTTGLGALLGIATGVAVGALAGAVRAAGVRVPLPAGIAATTAAALLVGNGPMTVLALTDPRDWSLAEWASDVVPHVGYGAVTSLTLRGLLP